MKKKLFLLTVFFFGSLVLQSQVLKDGAEDLLLPPFFQLSNPLLQDKTRNLSPSKKKLPELFNKVKNGDIVFIRSTSMQSAALEEVTGSRWTHVGVLFKVKKQKNSYQLLPDSDKSKDAQWMVFEAGPQVRFNPAERFVGSREFALLRFKENLNESEVQKLFSVALTRIGKPYDVYFLLSQDGTSKDNPDYCSELVWYVYAKAIGRQLGFMVQLGSQKLEGPQAQKLMKERLGRKSAPMSVAKWKSQYVIPPESQFVSPQLERIDQ